jgi:hypothetical protein
MRTYVWTHGNLDQEVQQGHLCVSTDPRRVGGPGGKPTIINIEELRALGKPVARFLHPAISNFIQKRLEELNSTGQAPSRMEKLAKRLEETWGRTYSNIQITSIASPKIAPQGKAT